MCTVGNQRKLGRTQEAQAAELNGQVGSSPDRSPAPPLTDAAHDLAKLQDAGTRTTTMTLSERPEPLFPRNLCHSNVVTPAIVQEIISNFEDIARQEFSTGSPRSDLLLTLIQFNVFRALVSNTFAMNFPFDWLRAEADSPFNTAHHSNPIRFSSYPPGLQPTTLQIAIPHHPWIDLFPFPKLRDNMLAQGEDFEDDDLCYDLVETCHAPSERSGLIVWGDAWRPESWEVTEQFARKWGWMLRDCEDLLRVTNFWRRQRGEDDLHFEALNSSSVADTTDIPIHL